MPRDAVETAPRGRIEQLRDRRCRRAVRRAATTPVYRERFREAGLDPDGVDGVADLRELPFTTKADLRERYPDGLVAVESARRRRIHASSGTTGTPKVVAYTDRDLSLWRGLCARSLSAAGVDPGDVVQNAAGYGLFTGGLGWHYGIEDLGATAVPTGAGNTARQVELAADIGTDALITIPSYAVYLAERVRDGDRVPSAAALDLSAVLVGAEPSTPAMRADVADRYGAVVTENYGLSELLGPGMATECARARDGMHLWEDHFYPEVVDPGTGDPVPEGEAGELVLTALTREAMPLLRYRTGDVTSLNHDPCPCGRTHVRLDGITGRTDDMVTVRGVNVYPTEVEAVALEFDDLAPHYRIDLTRPEGGLDRVAVTVERARGVGPDRGDRLERDLAARLEAVLGLSPDDVSVLAHGSLERTAGKARRVYDDRDLAGGDGGE